MEETLFPTRGNASDKPEEQLCHRSLVGSTGTPHWHRQRDPGAGPRSLPVTWRHLARPRQEKELELPQDDDARSTQAPPHTDTHTPHGRGIIYVQARPGRGGSRASPPSRQPMQRAPHGPLQAAAVMLAIPATVSGGSRSSGKRRAAAGGGDQLCAIQPPPGLPPSSPVTTLLPRKAEGPSCGRGLSKKRASWSGQQVYLA